MKKLDCYYINRKTCAIIPIDSDVSKVIELDDAFVISKSTTDIVDDSCKYFGCSFRGRLDGSKKVLNMNYKLPIVIEEFNDIIFFPTSSPRFKDCTWIALKNVVNYYKYGNGTRIEFSDICNLDLSISYYSLENQIFRATMLESLIRRRKLEKN